MRGEGMPVGDEVVAVVVFLHLHEVLNGSVIIAEMEVSCRANAAKYDFFHVYVLEILCKGSDFK